MFIATISNMPSSSKAPEIGYVGIAIIHWMTVLRLEWEGLSGLQEGLSQWAAKGETSGQDPDPPERTGWQDQRAPQAQTVWLGFRAGIHYQQRIKCKYRTEARVYIPGRVGFETKELNIGGHIDIYTGSRNGRLGQQMNSRHCLLIGMELLTSCQA